VPHAVGSGGISERGQRIPFHEFDARSELVRARATRQQQAVAIDRLGKTLSTFRRGVTALQAENSELRAENDGFGPSGAPGEADQSK
jgi:hypothetical protein